LYESWVRSTPGEPKVFLPTKLSAERQLWQLRDTVEIRLIDPFPSGCSSTSATNTSTRCSPAGLAPYRIITMVLLSVLLGPVATLSSARSLAFNCFVASTICFVIYYVTSVNMNAMTNGALLLRGGGGQGDAQGDLSALEIDQYTTQHNSAEAFAEIAWIMSFGGSVSAACFPFHHLKLWPYGGLTRSCQIQPGHVLHSSERRTHDGNNDRNELCE
jgi:hypothetical protein